MAFTLRLGNVLGESVRRIVCTAFVSLLAVAMLSACDDGSPPAAISPASPGTPEPNIQFIGAADLSDESKTSLAELIERIQSSVVQITIGSSSGSGFIIDANGLIITNEHVVAGARSVGVRLTNGRFYEADVLERDATADLALVQIDSNDRFHAIAVGNPDGVRVGDEVLALGFPLADRIGDSLTVTRGIISSTRTVSGVDLLQTDAAINPGNSGGPLVNGEGAVIGVNTSRIEETDSGRPVNSIGFAVSVIELERRLPTLTARRVSNPVATTPTPTALLTPTPTIRPVDVTPSFTSSVADLDYTAGTAVSGLTLPAATGGNGPLIYTLTPAVPGLKFSPQTRQLTGTPASPGTYSMTYGVTGCRRQHRGHRCRHHVVHDHGDSSRHRSQLLGWRLKPGLHGRNGDLRAHTACRNGWQRGAHLLSHPGGPRADLRPSHPANYGNPNSCRHIQHDLPRHRCRRQHRQLRL